MKDTKKEGDETVVSYDTRMKGNRESRGTVKYCTQSDCSILDHQDSRVLAYTTGRTLNHKSSSSGAR